jgi:ribose 5-phosphate isomerase
MYINKGDDIVGVIVRNKKTHKKYMFLGTGFGAYKAIRPSFFGGNVFPHEEEGTVTTVAVCDSKGDIIWINSNDLQVIEVDGIKITEMDIDDADEIDDKLVCPACGTMVDKNEKYCHECGLTLF